MAVAAAALDSQRIFVASQWQLMWWRFRKHKVAVASAAVVLGFYAIVLGADFLAYADPNASEAQRSLMPPQRVHLFDGWRFAPHVYGVKGARDPQTFKRVYVPDPEKKIRLRLFAEATGSSPHLAQEHREPVASRQRVDNRLAHIAAPPQLIDSTDRQRLRLKPPGASPQTNSHPPVSPSLASSFGCEPEGKPRGVWVL